MTTPIGSSDGEREALRARFDAWTKTTPEFAPEFQQHRAWAEQFAWFAVLDLYAALSSDREMAPEAKADLERDAARYRWLRTQEWNTSRLFVVAGGKSAVRLGTDCPSLFRLDEAIDAALASSAHIAQRSGG